MDLRLRLHKRPDGSVVLDLGLGFRIVFITIVVILVASFFVGGSVGIIGILFFVVAVFGAMYTEQWVFLPENRKIIAKTGIIVFGTRREWSFDDITAVRAVMYRTGTVPRQPEKRDASAGPGADSPARQHFFQRRFLRYELVTRSEDTIRIEIRRIRETDEPWALPEAIGTVLGVPIENLTS